MTRIVRVDPEDLPPDPEFEARRGPAIAPERLGREALRALFVRGGTPPIEQDNDGGYFRPDLPLRPAAVLLGVVERGQGPQLLFTQRSERLHDHAGQISFPGGRTEVQDAGPAAAALREAHEEIGLAPAQVEVLGTLPVYRTISGYEVTPVVGWVDAAATLQVDPTEVDEAFEVPLAFLMDGANHQRRLVVQGEHRRTVYAIEWQGARRYLIWGATAAMLRNFYRFVLEGGPPLQSRP